MSWAIVCSLVGCDSGGTSKNAINTPISEQPSLSRSYALEQLFKRVLIIGASVSEGAPPLPPSPGYLAALQAGASPGQIIIQAKSGVASSVHEEFINNQIPVFKPTIVFALDLFYADCKSAFDQAAQGRAENLIHMLCSDSDEVFLGLVPEGKLTGAANYNRYVRNLKDKYQNLYLVPLDVLAATATSGGAYLQFPNHREVVDGGLFFTDDTHPNLFGSMIIANQILALIRQYNPGITDTDLPNVFESLHYGK